MRRLVFLSVFRFAVAIFPAYVLGAKSGDAIRDADWRYCSR
jgi:hypothetical protein